MTPLASSRLAGQVARIGNRVHGVSSSSVFRVSKHATPTHTGARVGSGCRTITTTAGANLSNAQLRSVAPSVIARKATRQCSIEHSLATAQRPLSAGIACI